MTSWAFFDSPQAAEQALRPSMELGGNAPFIVFADADLDAALEGAMLAKIRNVGESCTAANRFLVAEELADTFAERLAQRRPSSWRTPSRVDRLAPDARVLREEIFGPVAPVAPFRTEEDAIARANATQYGLVAYVSTRDLNRALRVSEALETGMVGLNQGVLSNPAAPFGGVKRSGFGGRQGLEEYLDTKYMALAIE